MNLEDLKTIASAATPGPWESKERGFKEILNDFVITTPHGGILFRSTSYWRMKEDATHIATFGPELVSALIDEVIAARQMRHEMPTGKTTKVHEFDRVRERTEKILGSIEHK